MWDVLQNLRTADLEVREPLNGTEKNWVIGMLKSRNGVNGALWPEENSPRLKVEYDADLVNGPELLDLLQACGLHARPASPRRE